MPWYRRGGKRLFDVAVAGLGAWVFMLPMLGMMGGIGWTLGPPVFFRQTRVGRGGRLFSILKFRTMTPEGQVSSALGRWLRATAMDELPQLINILKGEMSFVGPRPLIPEELSELAQIINGRDRLLIRPGLTGLAQIYSDKTPSLPERIRWDLQYADQSSLALDLKILLKSIGVTLRGAWEKPRMKNRSTET